MTASHQTFARITRATFFVAIVLFAGIGMGIAPSTATSMAVGEETTDITEISLEDVDVPSAVAVNESFTVDATALTEREDVAGVCWRFDEEDSCHSVQTSHRFTTQGSHTATLIVTGTDGDRESHTMLIIATTPPTAQLSAPNDAEAGEEFSLAADGSTDDHSITTYEWDLDNDGTVDRTSESPSVQHTFDRPGKHEVTVTIVDPAGQRDSASVTIDVADATSSDVDESNVDGEQSQQADGWNGVLIVLGLVMFLLPAVVLVAAHLLSTRRL